VPHIRVALCVLGLSALSIRADEPPTVAELVRQLESGAPGARVIAAEALGERGPAAADAITALVKVMRAPKLNDRADALRLLAARDALVRIGPKAVPALTDLLAHEAAPVRAVAAEALGWLGPPAADAVPALGKLLADQSAFVKARAADALARIGPKAESAVPALVKLLGEPASTEPPSFGRGQSGDPKTAATAALKAVGPKGVAALREYVLPGLIEQYKTAKPTPWDGPGVATLAALGPDAAGALPAIKAYVRRRDSSSDLDALVPVLLKMGPDGVKAFQELLADTKADRRAMIGAVATSRAYGNQGDLTPIVPTLVAALKDENPAIRSSAAWALSDLGARTPPEVINVLVAQLGAPDVDRGAAFARIGAPAVPALVRALKAEDPKVQTRAASALGQIGGRARAALPELRGLARSQNVRVALEASAAAARVSLDPKDATALFGALEDADPKVRVEALAKLRALDALAAPGQAALIRLLKDENAEVQVAAVQSVCALGRTVPDAVAALARALPPPEKWGPALNGYGPPLGPTFAPAVPALRKALAHPKPDVRDTACRLLAQIGPGAKDAVPELLAALTEKGDRSRAPAVLATLGAIGPDAKGAIPVLLETPLPVRGTILCLAEIGPAAKQIVPTLRELQADPDPEARVLAAFALARIEGDAAKQRAALGRAMLPPPGGSAGGTVPTVFAKLAPDCPELIPAAARLLPALTPHDRGVLVSALGKYGPAAKGVVPDLLAVLKDEAGFPPHREIAEALGAIGPAARAALPELNTLLDHRDLRVALAAKRALERIEGTK